MSLLASSHPAAAEKRVALVIGNSAYKNVSPLDNPKNDAQLIAKTLTSVGFKLVGGTARLDLDKAGLDTAIQDFGDQLADADVALFYYAGHGVQVRGSNYMIPVNANPTKEADIDFQLVDVALVLHQMEGSRTKLNMVILDACRNNPLAGRGLRSAGGGLAQLSAPEGTLISYATSPGNVAQDGDDGDSPFSKALAQTILRPGLDIFETFNEVGLAVKRTTGGEQTPWVSSSPINGKFYFAAAPSNGNVATSHSPPSPSDEAWNAWNATKESNNPAVVKAFIQRYGDSFYGVLAKAKLDELTAAAAALAKSQQTQQQASIAPKDSAPVQNPGIPDRIGGSPSSGQAAPNAQRVVLYDEDPTNPKGAQSVGTVLWRTEEVINGPNRPSDIAVRADIDIPLRKFKMTMVFRRNTDAALPASHTAELTFDLPSDFVGGRVNNVPGILMKSNEQARGTALAGLGVKIAEGSFLFGLSNVDADRARNVQLLKERSWFDVPMVYANQRRAIIAIEKGTTGDRAFSSALSLWDQATTVKN